MEKKNFDWKHTGNYTSYRFFDSEQAESLIWFLYLETKEQFMDKALFSTIEDQFADNGWDWPDEMDWTIFVDTCSGIWISFDKDIVFLDESNIKRFLEGFKNNFQGYISDKVSVVDYGSDFEITIGGRSVTFDGDFQVIASGSVVG